MSNIVVTPEDWNSITPSTPAVAALHTDRTCAADAGGGVGVLVVWKVVVVSLLNGDRGCREKLSLLIRLRLCTYQSQVQCMMKHSEERFKNRSRLFKYPIHPYQQLSDPLRIKAYSVRINVYRPTF